MKKVLVFNDDGTYKEDKIVEDDYKKLINEHLTEIDTQISFYSPKLVNGEIVEGLAQEEIDLLKNQPVIPTPEEEIEKIKSNQLLMQNALDELLLNGSTL